jgi:hypothetical protein
MTKLFLLTVLSILLYAPDTLTGYEKMREYFPNMKERHYIEIRKNIKDTNTAKYFMSIIQYESMYNEKAYNGNDSGIAQINRVHGEPSKFFDYKVSIAFGARYFKTALQSSQGDYGIAVAKYNAGINANLAKYKGWRGYARRVCFKYDEIKDVRI